MIEAKTGKVLPLQRVLDKRCRFELLLHLVRSPFPFPDSLFLILKIASVDDKHKSKFCRGKVSFAVADVGHRKDLARIDKNKDSV